MGRSRRYAFGALIAAIGAGVAAAAWLLGRHHQALLLNAPAAGGSVEWDFYYSYVRDARRMAAGLPPLDEFRGPLYPAVLAAILRLAPSASLLTIAKIVSALSAGVTAAGTAVIGRRAAGSWIGAMAAAAAAAAPTFVLHGVLVGTDMFFAALTICATWLLMRATDGNARWAAAAGAAAGLALTARWNAVFLPMAALGACAIRRSTDRGERARWLAAYIVAALLVVSPWWALNTMQHGSPLHNRNAVNLSLALRGDAGAADSIVAALRAAPAANAGRWILNVVNGIRDLVSDIWLVAVAAVTGVVLLIRRGVRDRALWTLLLTAGTLVAVNALGPFAPRQYIFFVQVVFVCAGAAVQAGVRALRSRPAAVVAAVTYAATALALVSASTTRAVRAMRESEEVSKPAALDATVRPIAGDWSASGHDEIGLARAENGVWVFYAAIPPSGGPAAWIAAFGGTNTQPLAGRWIRGKRDGIGVMTDGHFHLKRDVFSGFADENVALGEPGDTPLVGDWNGDGVDELAVVHGSTFTFLDGARGNHTRQFSFGHDGDVPVAGDWNGDGIETVGVFHAGTFELTNRSAPPFDDITRMPTNITDPAAVPFAGRLLNPLVAVPAVYLPAGTVILFGPQGRVEWKIDLRRLDDLPVVR